MPWKRPSFSWCIWLWTVGHPCNRPQYSLVYVNKMVVFMVALWSLGCFWQGRWEALRESWGEAVLYLSFHKGYRDR